MKDLGMTHYFLGLEVWQRTDEILLSRGKYTGEVYSGDFEEIWDVGL
jgi:hypothetical protein